MVGFYRELDQLGTGNKVHKPLCIEWANKEAPLYSTGNCIQYHMLNHNGKEYESLYILIYV